MVKIVDEREAKNVVTVGDLCQGDFFLFRNALWICLDEDNCACKDLTHNYFAELTYQDVVEIPDLEIRIKKK